VEALHSNGLATAIITNGHPEIQARAPHPSRDAQGLDRVCLYPTLLLCCGELQGDMGRQPSLAWDRQGLADSGFAVWRNSQSRARL
jgi:hypothetical protein